MPDKDPIREERIYNEAIVDAYDEEERSLGWYYYVEQHMNFPFRAKCTTERSISPLKIGEEVIVTGMAAEDDCRGEIFVIIQWMNRNFGVPLAQLTGIDTDSETSQAIGDWKYWVEQGYRF
jgi:hypothetical protein